MKRHFEIKPEDAKVPEETPQIEKHFNLSEFKRAITEFIEEFNLKNSPAFVPDRKMYGLLQRILHPDRPIKAKWNDEVEQPSLPDHVDWLPDRLQANIKKLCHYLEWYHNLPIITDEHDTDGEREESKDAIKLLFGGAAREFVDQSKLRNAPLYGLRNIFEGVLYGLTHLEEPNSKTNTLLAIIMKLRSQFSINGKTTDIYLQWSKGEKLAFAEKIDPHIREFYDEIQKLYGSDAQ